MMFMLAVNLYLLNINLSSVKLLFIFSSHSYHGGANSANVTIKMKAVFMTAVLMNQHNIISLHVM